MSAQTLFRGWVFTNAIESFQNSAEELRHELEGLLQYPVHTAGGIMTTEFVELDPNDDSRLQRSNEFVRSQLRKNRSTPAMYMEPGTKHLLGAVSLRDLVMADTGRTLNRSHANQADHSGCA